MRAGVLVATLRSKGVELVPAGDRIRFRPASKVPPELLACLRERKAEILRLLDFADQYRALLRQGFALIARGADASREACALFLTEQARFADELSPELAEMIGRETARGWWTDTGRCPWCGEAGEFHDPGGPPAGRLQT